MELFRYLKKSIYIEDIFQYIKIVNKNILMSGFKLENIFKK